MFSFLFVRSEVIFVLRGRDSFDLIAPIMTFVLSIRLRMIGFRIYSALVSAQGI